jgi:hypothetical protein
MAPDYPLILEDCEYPQLKFEKTDPNIIFSFYNTYRVPDVASTTW